MCDIISTYTRPEVSSVQLDPKLEPLVSKVSLKEDPAIEMVVEDDSLEMDEVLAMEVVVEDSDEVDEWML